MPAFKWQFEKKPKPIYFEWQVEKVQPDKGKEKDGENGDAFAKYLH
jgi:hypothetical protein